MITKTITYTDYNGLERTEKFYFNLSEVELSDGDIYDTLVKITNTGDPQTLLGLFKKIILAAYGEKSEDGRRFIKNDEIRSAFSQTEAYSKLFMELATDDTKGAEFVNGILPASLAAKVSEETPAIESSTTE